MSPYFVGASRVGKAELFILDPRMRKDDHRGCVSVRDNLSRTVVPPLSSPSKLGPRVQDKESLFWGCDNIPHSPIKTTC